MPDTRVRRFLQKFILTSAAEVVFRKPVRIHELVLDNILEYSTSLPTGQYAGKRWKRRQGDGWVLGEYIDDGADDGTLLIQWTPIEVITRGAKDV